MSQVGANAIKGAIGYKVKVFSKVYIWHMVFLCLSIFLIFTFFIPNLQLCFEYSYFWLYLDLYHFIYNAFMFWIMQKWITFVKDTFSKFIIFRVKYKFETNMFKCVLKWILSISSAFFFIVTNDKILLNLKKEWCTFDKKKGLKKKLFFQLLWTCKRTFETSWICMKFWTMKLYK
jgi:hypothetical protein